MEIKGAYKVAAPREQVWTALNDPDILKKCLPGCEKLEREGDNAFTATIKVKVGPVSAKFSGAVTLEDLDPPNGYRIVGEGKGGVAGFAKGGAKVTLRDDGGATVALSGGRTATASATGVYELTGLAPGTYTITVTRSGYRTASITRTVSAGADNWGSVSLTRGGATGALVGVVYRGTDTTARLAGAAVRLGTGQTTTADGNGVYRFAAVGEGAVTITASAAGHLPRTITKTIVPAVENWGSVGLAQGQALESACGGVSFEGACDGAVVSYCHEGELYSVDCSAHGGTCGWNGDEGYHDCL